MNRPIPALILSLAIAGCATSEVRPAIDRQDLAQEDIGRTDRTETSRSERERMERELLGECDASAAQSLVGERATSQLGERLLQLTGARTLRWAPPNSALTMDFRADRLTVAYDDAYLIERISCG